MNDLIMAPAEHLSDAELEERLKRLAGIERKALVLLLSHLGEFDQRRLYADRGYPSLFSYCMKVLGYSEQAAYKRIQAARAARDHPGILQRLADGELTLTAAVILAPHLRADNAHELLAAARGQRTREIQALAASLAPRPDAPDCLRALPFPQKSSIPPASAGLAPAPSVPEAGLPGDEVPGVALSGAPEKNLSVALPPAPRPKESIEPLSDRRYIFRFTGSAALLAKYERSREFLGQARSGGSMEKVIETGLDALLDKLDPERRIARRKARQARGRASRPASRRISMGLRDTVWERDGGRCTFVEPGGARCPATTHLEIDHIRPYALGGVSDDAANLRVLCRTHNQLLARRMFGASAGPRSTTAESDYPQG